MKHRGFIVGPERSGTTLTSAYLSSHRSLYVINDPHYLNFFFDIVTQANKQSLINTGSRTGEFGKELEVTFKHVLNWYARWDEFKDDPVSIDKFV